MSATNNGADDARYPSLRDRVVLVTGGANGIGASIVEHFAKQGAAVAFFDIDAAAGEGLAARLRLEHGAEMHFAVADVTDIAALQAAIATAATKLGPVSVLVNNAAHDQRHAWQDVTPEYWDDRIAVNLRHHFFAIQAVAPMMVAAGGGSIINLGSTSWRMATGGMPVYVASKAAIEGLTRGFARDLGSHRIRVNCLLPGWIMTERQVALWVKPDTDAYLKQVQCLPDKLYAPDIARMALWLAADDSRMCSSQSWVVDGGWI